MNSVLRYLETGSLDPAYNLAFEEVVLTCRREGDCLLLWQNDNTVVVGLNQITAAQIDPAFVEAHGIRVVRRATGGGAVYHDLGNLNYSFITDAGDAETRTPERFTGAVVAALRALGLDASASGRNDILVAGRKVSGTAQRILNGRLLFHGTLLFDSRPDMITGALRVNDEKFRSKGVASVESRVGTIRSFLKEDMDLPSFWARIKQSFAAGALAEDTLSPEELDRVRALKAEKYDTWAWNYGRSPEYTFQNRRRFPGGELDVRFLVEEGYIREAAFFGDFLAKEPLTPLCDALRGCPFGRAPVAERLSRFPMESCFGGITREEVLSLLFG